MAWCEAAFILILNTWIARPLFSLQNISSWTCMPRIIVKMLMITFMLFTIIFLENEKQYSLTSKRSAIFFFYIFRNKPNIQKSFYIRFNGKTLINIFNEHLARFLWVYHLNLKCIEKPLNKANKFCNKNISEWNVKILRILKSLKTKCLSK